MLPTLDLYIHHAYAHYLRRTEASGNLKVHGFDFQDAQKVFEGPTFTVEDDRFNYGEQRFVTLGFLGGLAVSIAHTETEEHIHVISFRRASRNEEATLFERLQN